MNHHGEPITASQSRSATHDVNSLNATAAGWVLLKRWLAVAQLSLVAATWKLWTPQTDFPQVPLIRAACDWPGGCDWVCLIGLVTSSIAMLIAADNSRVSRIASAGTALSLGGFFVLDQHRLQPWAWQFLLLAILLSLADDVTARRGWIWLVVSIYFWSAVSKLDYTFFHEQGPALLGGLKLAMGLEGMPNRWTQQLDVAGSMFLAAGELGVAVLLAYPRTRWLGLWTAIVMHAALLAALGPMGLNHANGVLLWNLFFIGQDWLLFRRAGTTPSFEEGVPSTTQLHQFWNRPIGWNNRLAMIGVLIAIGWPTLEPIGLCDHWLAWSVYSARPGRSDLLAGPEMDVQNLPMRSDEFRVVRMMLTTESMDHPITLRKLGIAQWSLDQLSVPIYPQNRFQVGVAWSLVEDFQFRGSLILFPATSRWDGTPLSGLFESIEFDPAQPADFEQIAATYYWNARPRRLRPRDPK